MHDLDLALILLADTKSYRALDAVQIVIETGFRRDEQRRGDAQEIELLRERLLEEILHGLDRDLRIVERQL